MRLNKKVREMAQLSTIIEIFLGALACFILPQAFLIGFLIGLGGVMIWFCVGHFVIQSSNPIWRAQLWERYCISIAKRQPTISTLISDNVFLVLLLVYAFIVKDSVTACGLLGIAAAFSSITLVQSFIDKRSSY